MIAGSMSIIISILITFHVLVCLLMVTVVLMQRPKNEGLGAAFGGGMTENIFGAQTTHVLQKFTVWLGIIFFLLTLTLAVLYAKRGAGTSAIQKELMSLPQPVATPAATPAPPSTETVPPSVPTTGETAPGTTPVPSAPAVEQPAPAVEAAPPAPAAEAPAAAPAVIPTATP